jgi:hypothetical protein
MAKKKPLTGSLKKAKARFCADLGLLNRINNEIAGERLENGDEDGAKAAADDAAYFKAMAVKTGCPWAV